MTHVEGTYECPKCDKKCSTKMALYTHIKDVHSPKLICECCNKTFSAKRNLIAHLKNVEAAIENSHLKNIEALPLNHNVQLDAHKCDICDKVFKSKMSLIKHDNNVHKEDSDFSDESWILILKICNF